MNGPQQPSPSSGSQYGDHLVIPIPVPPPSAAVPSLQSSSNQMGPSNSSSVTNSSSRSQQQQQQQQAQMHQIGNMSSASSSSSTPSPHHHSSSSSSSYLAPLAQNYLDFNQTNVQQSAYSSPPPPPPPIPPQTILTSGPGQMSMQQQQQQQQQQCDLFVQMQQQYEQQIRALQMEIQAMKQICQQFNNNNNNSSNPSIINTTKKSSSNKSGAGNSVIHDTYCEELHPREYRCKNCSYKTKSEASLIIHQSNHLVSQRYLHLPTTVFSIKSNENLQDQSSFLYPCSECSGKFSHNDLYLHIYQYHTGENPFHCDECNLFFMHYEFLDDHQRTQHMNKNLFNDQNHQQKPKRSRSSSYIDSTANTTSIRPHLAYYSVIKCSKPFTEFLNSNPNRPNNPSAWNHHFNNTTAKNQPAFPYHRGGGVSGPRGRGRGASTMIAAINPSRTSAMFRNLTPNIINEASNEMTSSSRVNDLNDVNDQFKCHYEDCFFATDTKERLDFHLFAHRSSRFKCPYCPYVSNVLNDIKRHCVKGQNKHEGRPMFVCPHCPTGDANQMQTNCDKTFKDHIRAVHFFGKMIDDRTIQQYVEDLFRNNDSGAPPPTAAAAAATTNR